MNVVFRHALIYDGLGGPPVVGDLGVVGAQITEIGDLSGIPADIEVDCEGLALTPGFIDVHSHDDLAVFRPGGMEPKVRQGVTTVINGNCGHGVAPVDSGSQVHGYSDAVLGDEPREWSWEGFDEYLAAVVSAKPPVDVITLAPHGVIRAGVMGFEPREATRNELDKILAQVNLCLNAGAAGVSFGLMYAPGYSAGNEELRSIAVEVARAGKVLAVHIRAEGSHIFSALDEVYSFVQGTGVTLHISHLKCTGKSAHGWMPRVLDTLDGWRDAGIDVTVDVYPYVAGSTTICGALPERAMAGGVEAMLVRLGENLEVRNALIDELRQPWPRLENHLLACGAENIVIIGMESEQNLVMEGLPLSEIASRRGQNAEEALLDLIVEEKGRAGMIQHQGNESDLEDALRWHSTMIGSDGLPLDRATPHPRLYGTFPRILAKYSRERGVLSTAEAIRRMTSLPASRFGLHDRGALRVGARADLVVANLETVQDQATYQDPRRSPTGIDQVWIRGQEIWSTGA